ncbi:MAG: ABC transporter ATP-binding protein [Candidatus Uhrbacteria bacterium]|nr:ABC transporter ATP-binding protein [Candidatus Uhrbacteria bacterium]
MNAIEIHDIHKTYATGVKALRGVSFDIREGEMMALLGANGAGKTTLIGILTGLVNKTAGKVTVLGHDLDTDPEAVRSCIGVVPQEFNFNIFERVIDIVVDQAGYYGVPRNVARPRAEALLKQLGLWEKREAFSRTLSGGMKRRLMIARALVHQPKILLLDEPSAGVDVELRHGMWQFIRRLHEEGTTILLTTHYLEEAEQLCERVVIFREGNVVRQGAVAELLQGLDAQSFVLTVDGAVELGGEFNLVLQPNGLVDASIAKGRTVTDLVAALAARGVTVTDIKQKSNRLEEVFLSLSGSV